MSLSPTPDTSPDHVVVVKPWRGFLGHFGFGGKAVAVRLGRPGSDRPVVLEVAFSKVLDLTAEQAECLGAELIAVARAARGGAT